LPTIPITSPQFVYRRAHQTDLRATFARARAGLASSPDPPQGSEPPARDPGGMPMTRAASGVRLVR
jgi:hypothetical protein